MFHPPSQDKFLAHKFSPRNDYGCSTILLSFRYFKVYTTSLLEMSKLGQTIIFVSIINICQPSPSSNNRSYLENLNQENRKERNLMQY